MSTLFNPTSFKRLSVQAICLAVMVALLAAFLPQPVYAQVAAADSCAKKYTVVSGDTLSKIANDNKVTTAELATANDLKEPYTLYVGQVLCIPGTATTTTTSDAEESASKGPSMKLEVSGKFLVVTTSGFPTKSSFYVKAAEGRFRTTKFVKIGLLRTKKTGAVEKVYRLPKGMEKVAWITVCVKNVVTDATLCQNLQVNP